MALAPIGASPGPGGAAAASGASVNGLDFQSLLKIILTQLTYQDPLKPMDNFQFVSQLAQFSQLQQSQTLNDQVTSLLTAQSASQAAGLLGKTVDFVGGGNSFSGVVKAVSFSTGQPQVTVETPDGQSISAVSIADITQIR